MSITLFSADDHDDHAPPWEDEFTWSVKVDLDFGRWLFGVSFHEDIFLASIGPLALTVYKEGLWRRR